MKKLSLKAKLWLNCGSLLAILLAVGAIGYWSTWKTDVLVRTVQFNVKKQNLSYAIQLAFEKEKVGARDALLHNDSKYLTDAHADFEQQMETLKPLLTSATSRQLFAQIQDASVAYGRILDQAIQLNQAGDHVNALDLFYGASAQQTRADMKKSTNDLESWYGKLAADAEVEQLASGSRTKLFTAVFTCIGLLVGSLVAIVSVRSLITSIVPIVSVMEAISHHNLCIPDVEVTTEDELGQAGRALNTMKGNLSRLVRSITQSAEQLAGATEEIAQGAKQNSSGAHAEAEQAFQVASAMQEMSATVREVADHAHHASDASSQSATAARKGGEIADETLITMNSIASSTAMRRSAFSS